MWFLLSWPPRNQDEAATCFVSSFDFRWNIDKLLLLKRQRAFEVFQVCFNCNVVKTITGLLSRPHTIKLTLFFLILFFINFDFVFAQSSWTQALAYLRLCCLTTNAPPLFLLCARAEMCLLFKRSSFLRKPCQKAVCFRGSCISPVLPMKTGDRLKNTELRRLFHRHSVWRSVCAQQGFSVFEQLSKVHGVNRASLKRVRKRLTTSCTLGQIRGPPPSTPRRQLSRLLILVVVLKNRFLLVWTALPLRWIWWDVLYSYKR